MKKVIRNVAIVVCMMAMPFSFILAQNTLGKVWEKDRNFNHSDAGRLIQAYHDDVSNANYAVTAAILDDYSKLNVSKVDEWGNRLWTKNLGTSDLTYWDPRKLIVDAEGNTFIAGNTYNTPHSRYEVFIGKLNSDGVLQWFSQISEVQQYLTLSGMDVSGENVYLSYWYVDYDDQGNITSHISTLKIDPTSGSEAWENEQDFPSQYAASLSLVHDASGIYQTGYITNADNNGYDILTMKHDESGNLVWQNTYSSGLAFAYSQGNDIAINGDGEAVVAGTTDYHHLIVLGYSSDGVQQFDYTKSFSQSGYVYNVQIDDNANSATYVACEVDNISQKIYLAQFDDNGNSQWDEFVGNAYFTSMKANPWGDGATVLGSFYDIHKHNYLPQLYGVDQSGSIQLMKQFGNYKGYNSVADFSTLDASSFYLAGAVRQNASYTDQMTSRWDVQPLRLSTPTQTVTASLFPNPCANATTLHFISDANDVYVYDVTGRLVTSFKNVSGDLQLATQDWAAGQYVIKISNANDQQTIKLIKE